MKIFVTGAGGFIGHAFCSEAKTRGHDILGLCRTPSSGLDCQVVMGSLQEMPWREIERFQPEAALHLAWIATPGVYLNSPENDLWAVQSQALFRGLAERGVRHLTGAGTCIEYASSPVPLLEDESPLHPDRPYSKAKAALSSWLAEMSHSLGVQSSWLRIFYPYGPGEHPGRLPSLIIRSLVSGKPFSLRTPDSVKDYIYIRDLALALCLTMEAKTTGAINIGSGQGITITGLAIAIAEVLGGDPNLITRADPLTADPWPVQIADVGRLQSIGWRPVTDLKTGLGKLVHQLLPAS